MSREYRILLIGNLPEDPWRQVIEEASASLGSLQFAREVDVFRLVRQQDFDVIVIDAENVEDVFLLISSIRILKVDAKIVAVTMSPIWRRAREAFRAGAVDYLRKSMNKEEILSALRGAIDKVPPLRRH